MARIGDHVPGDCRHLLPEYSAAFRIWPAGLETDSRRTAWTAAAGRSNTRNRHVYFHHDTQPDHRGQRDVCGGTALVGVELAQFRNSRMGEGTRVLLGAVPRRIFHTRSYR